MNKQNDEFKIALSKGDDYEETIDCMPIAGIHNGEHGNAVECYGKTPEAAAALRDHILDCVKRCEQLDAAKEMMATLTENFVVPPAFANLPMFDMSKLESKIDFNKSLTLINLTPTTHKDFIGKLNAAESAKERVAIQNSAGFYGKIVAQPDQPYVTIVDFNQNQKCEDVVEDGLKSGDITDGMSGV